ncbi:MAG: BMP family ABC transporter substrate-binding protein [Burkholderiaceae bacterium]
MTIDRRRVLGAGVGLGAGAALAAPTRLLAADMLKVGFVYVSPISDAGWTHQHELGRRHLQETLGSRLLTKFVENVPEGADAERVIRELAKDGHGLIFTTSFGYMNPTLKVARAFPKTRFVHVTGYKTAPNVAQVNARFYEGRYLAGMLAGATSRSGVAGYVAAFPIPEVLQGINAFTRGMRAVNPKATTRVIWVNTWYDPGKEREAALALASQGADVLTHHTDSHAVVQAAEEKKLLAVGYHSDMSKYGPNAQIAAVTHHWGDYYVGAAKRVLDGSWKSDMVWGGIREGFIKVLGVGKQVPADAVAKMRAVEAEIRAGRFHPFSGKVVNQSGRDLNPKGGAFTDADLGRMSYYVEGVVGQLPRK